MSENQEEQNKNQNKSALFSTSRAGVVIKGYKIRWLFVVMFVLAISAMLYAYFVKDDIVTKTVMNAKEFGENALGMNAVQEPVPINRSAELERLFSTRSKF
jgi:hypothetical protein